MALSDIELGVDCIDISRFEGKSEVFLKKLFTDDEIAYCEKRGKPTQHFASKFAGKESLIKAMNAFGVSLNLGNIEILNKKCGSPFVKLSRTIPDIYKIKITLSHSETMAMAMVIVTKVSDI